MHASRASCAASWSTLLSKLSGTVDTGLMKSPLPVPSLGQVSQRPPLDAGRMNGSQTQPHSSWARSCECLEAADTGSHVLQEVVMNYWHPRAPSTVTAELSVVPPTKPWAYSSLCSLPAAAAPTSEASGTAKSADSVCARTVALLHAAGSSSRSSAMVVTPIIGPDNPTCYQLL